MKEPRSGHLAGVLVLLALFAAFSAAPMAPVLLLSTRAMASNSREARVGTNGKVGMSNETAHSTYAVIGTEAIDDPSSAEIAVEIRGIRAEGLPEGEPLPVRVIVTASDSTHPDGSGHGVYADGRFFADSKFSVSVPPGPTHIVLRSGPNYLPLELDVTAGAGRRTRVEAVLQEWFSPEASGWYAGDNHVHAQHDAVPTISTGLGYTALQGRANGLSFITEAGSHVSYENMDKMSTDSFLLRLAEEAGSGCFVGHFNTPGIKEPIGEERYQREINHRVLPGQAITETVHELGGAIIHTHPLSPPYQLHWMGATEILSDAVLGRCVDALDIGGWDAAARRGTELLWFSVLNLGNEVACSSYTDSALGRPETLSPGDRRVYCRLDELSYEAIVDALRNGRTTATNAGPLFPYFTVNGQGPGARLIQPEGTVLSFRLEVRSLRPLKTAELIQNGNPVKVFDVKGHTDGAALTADMPSPDKGWFVARVEDQDGNWAITSPVYVGDALKRSESSASAMLFEISNATRFPGQLRRDFYAHFIVTVSESERLSEVQLLKDGQIIKRYGPREGDSMPSGKIPVTEFQGEYEAGHVWHPSPEGACHFQADYAVAETGWYSVRAQTECGRQLSSDAIFFDIGNPNCSETSVAHLHGPDTCYRLWGYGEEMPLAEVATSAEPANYWRGDWWYPHNTQWQIRAEFAGEIYETGGGDEANLTRRFRPIG